MKRSLFSLALASLAVTAAVPAFAQINTGGIGAVDFARGVFNLAEAYPCTVGSYATSEGVTDQQVFTGTCAAQTPSPAAAPGILCLQKHSGTEVLDVNCFAVTPPGQFGCVVQAYRFFKMVPGSFKCPDVYGVPHFDSNGHILFYTYIQFGSGIRTWWSLNFTQPGTRFLLQVVSACQYQPTATGKDDETVNVGAQQVVLHQDSWRWRVTADVNTLLNVINLMHEGAVSTLEVPCIIGEDMYDALVKAQGALSNDITGTSTTRLTDIANDLFNMEALIVANCLFTEVLNPTVAFPGPMQFGAPNIQPPGNAAPTVTFGTSGSSIAGIIDTLEHPCCCKLLVDLEWIAIQQGIIGQTPTLPVF